MTGNRPQLSVNKGKYIKFLNQKVTEWIKNKQHQQNKDPVIHHAQENHLKRHHRIKVKRWKILFNANSNLKEAWFCLFILKKERDFNRKTVSRDKKEYYIMINRSIKSEVITEIYTHSTRAHQANMRRHEWKNSQQCNNGRYQYHTLMDRTIRKSIQKCLVEIL